MSGDLTRADKRRVRQLADLAWERELRFELRKIGVAIQEMENASLSPFEVNDNIHRFHDGPSRTTLSTKLRVQSPIVTTNQPPSWLPSPPTSFARKPVFGLFAPPRMMWGRGAGGEGATRRVAVRSPVQFSTALEAARARHRIRGFAALRIPAPSSTHLFCDHAPALAL